MVENEDNPIIMIIVVSNQKQPTPNILGGSVPSEIITPPLTISWKKHLFCLYIC